MRATSVEDIEHSGMDSPPLLIATLALCIALMDCFVVGTGRCGTHLLRDMLNLHPIVYIPRETHWIPTMYTAFGLTPQPWNSYTNVVDRTYHATGIRTIDNILAEFAFHRRELYARLAEQFRDSQSVDLVTANTAIYRYLAAQKPERIAVIRHPITVSTCRCSNSYGLAHDLYI